MDQLRCQSCGLWFRSSWLMNRWKISEVTDYRIMGRLRLENTFKIIKSKFQSASPPWSPLNQVPKCHICNFFKQFQEWWVHHCPGSEYHSGSVPKSSWKVLKYKNSIQKVLCCVVLLVKLLNYALASNTWQPESLSHWEGILLHYYAWKEILSGKFRKWRSKNSEAIPCPATDIAFHMKSLPLFLPEN